MINNQFLDFHAIAISNWIKANLQAGYSAPTLYATSLPYQPKWGRLVSYVDEIDYKIDAGWDDEEYSMQNTIKGHDIWSGPLSSKLTPITWNEAAEKFTFFNNISLGEKGGISPMGVAMGSLDMSRARMQGTIGYKGMLGKMYTGINGTTFEYIDQSMIIPVTYSDSGGTTPLPLTFDKLNKIKTKMAARFNNSQIYLIISVEQEAYLRKDVQFTTTFIQGEVDGIRTKALTAGLNIWRANGIVLIVDPLCPIKSDKQTAYCPFFVEDGFGAMTGPVVTTVTPEGKSDRPDSKVIKSTIEFNTSRLHKFKVGYVECHQANNEFISGRKANVVTLDGTGLVTDVNYVTLA